MLLIIVKLLIFLGLFSIIVKETDKMFQSAADIIQASRKAELIAIEKSAKIQVKLEQQRKGVKIYEIE